MAGIYIPGFETPESCYYCPFADGVWQKDKRCLINGEEMPRDGRDVQQNHINCPIIPNPDHGDLIGNDMQGGIKRDENGNVIDWGITGPPGDPGWVMHTNADRIRAMSDEELADWVWGAETSGRAYGPRGKKAWLDWLKRPVEVE